MDGWMVLLFSCIVGSWTVVVDVSAQSLVLLDHCGTQMGETLSVSTGAPGFDTPVGIFEVTGKRELADLSSPVAYVEDVPWIIEYDRPYYLHGAYWHDDFGTPVSHGCVNLRVADAEWLYANVYIGDAVIVQW